MEQTTIQELYGGTIKLKFVPSNHSYWISRKEKKEWTKWERSTGVTTLIGIKDKSIPLKYWVSKIIYKQLSGILDERAITKYDLEEAKVLHLRRLKEEATSGIKVHDWIDSYVKGEKPDMPEEPAVLNGVNAFLDWMKSEKAKIVGSEIPLYSKEYNYCGKLDAIVKIKGKTYLLDFKTGAAIYNDVLLQTAAYVHASEEMGLGKLDGRWAIRLEKRSEEEFERDMDEKGLNVEYKPFEAVYLDKEMCITADFTAFLYASGLQQWNKESEKYIKSITSK